MHRLSHKDKKNKLVIISYLLLFWRVSITRYKQHSVNCLKLNACAYSKYTKLLHYINSYISTMPILRSDNQCQEDQFNCLFTIKPQIGSKDTNKRRPCSIFPNSHFLLLLLSILGFKVEKSSTTLNEIISRVLGFIKRSRKP